jgi:hypothetical protein
VVLNLIEPAAPLLGERRVWWYPWLQFFEEKYVKFRYYRNPFKAPKGAVAPRLRTTGIERHENISEYLMRKMLKR